MFHAHTHAQSTAASQCEYCQLNRLLGGFGQFNKFKNEKFLICKQHHANQAIKLNQSIFWVFFLLLLFINRLISNVIDDALGISVIIRHDLSLIRSNGTQAKPASSLVKEESEIVWIPMFHCFIAMQKLKQNCGFIQFCRDELQWICDYVCVATKQWLLQRYGHYHYVDYEWY